MSWVRYNSATICGVVLCIGMLSMNPYICIVSFIGIIYYGTKEHHKN